LLEARIGGGVSIARVVGEIKSLKPHIHIILCVDFIANDDIIKAAEYGVDDIVRKPYNKTGLLRAIRNAWIQTV
jgi:DNA-binding NarL/FixJ family response regulator